MLELLFTISKEMVKNVKVKDSLGCKDHETVQFKILRSEAYSRIPSLDFRRADFYLFRDLLGRIWRAPWRAKGTRRTS